MEENRKKNICTACKGELNEGAIKCSSCGEYVGITKKLVNLHIIPSIITLITGAILFYFGQHVERINSQREVLIREQKDNNKIMIALKMEAAKNIANLNNIQMLLEYDLKDLEKGTLTITPLNEFTYDAWNYAQYGSSNFMNGIETKNLFKLNNCYAVLKMIDTKIKDRELYRHLNENGKDFKVRMAQLDKIILKNISDIQPLMDSTTNYLYQSHNMIVQGGTFRLDKGLVEDVNE